jgi:hypothetical protein
MNPTSNTTRPTAPTDAWRSHLRDAVSAFRLRLFVSGGDAQLERALHRVEALLRRQREQAVPR